MSAWLDEKQRFKLLDFDLPKRLKTQNANDDVVRKSYDQVLHFSNTIWWGFSSTKYDSYLT